MSIQVITENERPAFAVIPYAEYETMRRKLAVAEKKAERVSVPLDVAEMHVMQGFSLMKAWRIYLKKTQSEVAESLGVTQGAYSQMEKSKTNQWETLRRVAAVFDVQPEQLTMEE